MLKENSNINFNMYKTERYLTNKILIDYIVYSASFLMSILSYFQLKYLIIFIKRFSSEATLHKIVRLVFRVCIFNTTDFDLLYRHIFFTCVIINNFKTSTSAQRQNTFVFETQSMITSLKILCSLASQANLSWSIYISIYL